MIQYCMRLNTTATKDFSLFYQKRGISMKRKYFNINVSMFFINKNVEWFEIVNFYKKSLLY